MEENFKNYIQDLGQYLKEKARDAKKDKDSSK